MRFSMRLTLSRPLIRRPFVPNMFATNMFGSSVAHQLEEPNIIRLKCSSNWWVKTNIRPSPPIRRTCTVNIRKYSPEHSLEYSPEHSPFMFVQLVGSGEYVHDGYSSEPTN